MHERKIAIFQLHCPPPAEFIRCIGNAQGPERMRECPEELRKSALFILNANGASLLLAASFGGQGSSKQKGMVEIGPRWKQGDEAVGVPGWWDGRREAPCTQQEVSLRVGDFEARGHPAAPRGHIPEGAESGSGASVSAHSLNETLYLEAQLRGPWGKDPLPQTLAYSAPFAWTRSYLEGWERETEKNPKTQPKKTSGVRGPREACKFRPPPPLRQRLA